MLLRIATLSMLILSVLFGPAMAEDKAVPADRAQMQLSFAPLVKQLAGTVVNVYADKQVAGTSLYSGDPFFEEFFGQQMPNRSEKQSSLGSGVIFDKQGLVITNNHVIAGADQVRVALSE